MMKRYREKTKKSSLRYRVLLTSLAIIFLLTAGTLYTFAFRTDSTDEVENIFAPAKVTTTIEEEFNNIVKKMLKLKMTATSLYISDLNLQSVQRIRMGI